MTGSYMPV